MTVLTRGKEGSCKGRFWTYIGDEYPYSVYDFSMSRSRDGPQKFLESFHGYLQADAYAGYDAIYLGSDNEIVEVACWAHARRKFFDACKNYPREAHQVLEWTRQLYDLEDRALELSIDARRDLRHREAMPVLDKLEAYLAELAPKVLPKSALAKAVTYARNQWKALRRYTEDGRLLRSLPGLRVEPATGMCKIQERGWVDPLLSNASKTASRKAETGTATPTGSPPSTKNPLIRPTIVASPPSRSRTGAPPAPASCGDSDRA